MSLNQVAIPIALQFTVNVGSAVNGLNQMNAALGGTRKHIEQTQNSFKQLAGAFTSIVAARYVAQGISAVVKPAMDLSMAFAKLRAFTSGTDSEMRAYKKEIYEVAKITPYKIPEMADAMLQLAQATGNADTALSLLRPTAKLAMASFGQMNMGQASNIMRGLVQGFHMTGTEAEKAANKIVSYGYALGVGPQKFSNITGRLGSAAMAGSQSFDEITKAAAVSIGPGGLSPERASTLLMSLGKTLYTPKAQSMFKVRLGMDLTSNGVAKRMVNDIAVTLAERWLANPSETESTIRAAVGDIPAKVLLPMTKVFAKGVNIKGVGKLAGAELANYLDTKGANQDILNQMSAVVEAEPATKVQSLGESFSRLGATIGSTVLPVVTALAIVFQKVVGVFTYFIENSSIVKFLLGATLAIGGTAAGAWALIAAVTGMKAIFMSVNAYLFKAGASTNVVASGFGRMAVGARAAAASIGTVTVAGRSLMAMLGPIGAILMAGYSVWNAVDTISNGVHTSGEMSEDSRKILEMHADAAGELKSAADLQKEAAQKQLEAAGYIQFGSDAMENALSELKDSTKYEFPTINESALTALTGQFSSIANNPNASFTARTTAQGGLRAAGLAQGALAEYQAGTMKPEEAQQFVSMMTAVNYGSKYLTSMGYINKKVMKTFNKDFATPLYNLGSTDNIRASDYTTVLGEGHRWTGNQGQIPGWDVGAGGFKPSESRQFPPGFMQSYKDLGGDRNQSSSEFLWSQHTPGAGMSVAPPPPRDTLTSADKNRNTHLANKIDDLLRDRPLRVSVDSLPAGARSSPYGVM